MDFNIHYKIIEVQIHIITAFPHMFESPFGESIISRAQENGFAKIVLHDLRKWTTDVHKSIDNKPYGGGAGMVLMLEPIYKAVKEIKASLGSINTKVLLTSAKGVQYNQSLAKEFSQVDALIIICGHYEGVDERVAKHICDYELSIGKFVLTGGEIPAMLITDSVIRLIPGVLGNEESLSKESYSEGDDLEAPHYTRPSSFKSDQGDVWSVPETLLSGNHKEIDDWRKKNTSTVKDS